MERWHPRSRGGWRRASRQRRPGRRLVVRFALASLLAFLGVAVLLHVLLGAQVRKEHLQQARDRATFAIEHVLAPALTDADLTQPVTGARYQQLRAFVRTHVMVSEVRRVKIWRPDGTVLFSDDVNLVGRTFPDEVDELAESLTRSTSDVSNLSAAENVDERRVGTSMFETHAPLASPAGGEPIAVAEIYEDYAPAQAAAARFLRTLDITLGVGLLLLYLLLLAIAYRISRFLQRQTLQLQEHADALDHSRRRFRALVQGSGDLITVVDPDGIIGYQSPGITAALGHEPDAVAGRHVQDLVHPADQQTITEALRARTVDTTGSVVAEARWRHADGSWRYIESLVSDLLAEPSVAGLTLNSRDVTDRRTLEDQLSHQAFHDSLTQLANRALFRDRLEHALARTARAGSLAVLFVDLDNFKSINDGIGHVAGDQALVVVAGRLHGALRTDDTLARLGGDEFAVLVEDLDGPDDAAEVAANLIEALSAPFLIDGRSVSLGASIGIVTAVRGSADDAESLMRAADVAMYRAKTAGKGRAAVFTEDMHAAAAARLQLEVDLRRAVDCDEFVLHYQPVIALDSDRLVGVEALIRWQDPIRGLIPPLEFIPVAEETGLILAIGRTVLHEACAQAQQWLSRFDLGPEFHVAVNVSPRQVRETLIDDVTSALNQSGLPAHRLVVEITEGLVMDSTDGTVEALTAVREMGVSIAIDDFGTGYSSLSYLQNFPVDILKIDKSFVNHPVSAGESDRLIRGIVQLGQALGLHTVAEGIERFDQIRPLREMGCERGQGYFYSRPVNADALTALLDQTFSRTGSSERRSTVAAS